jgi:hypothetical protein
MDKPHKQVITTYPIALKYGQSRLHVPNPIPWHTIAEAVKCEACEAVYVLTGGFPKVQFLQTMKEQHEKKQEHPDLIAYAPEWTRTENCGCGL